MLIKVLKHSITSNIVRIDVMTVSSTNTGVDTIHTVIIYDRNGIIIEDNKAFTTLDDAIDYAYQIFPSFRPEYLS